MRAVAYLRVSSTSQVDGYSLAAQERMFHEACKNRGWESVRVYREEGKSAHTDSISKRPVLRQLLKDASKGEFDLVVVHTLDRWARNTEVLLRSVRILKENGVELHSITESLDNSNSQGRLMLQLLGSFAEFSSDMLSEHVKKGLQERAMQGLNTGSVPFGYRSCWTKEHGVRKRICEPEHSGGIHRVPEEAEAVKELYRRYSAGDLSTGALASWLNEQGFRTRNTKKLSDGAGNLYEGPRLFTAHAVGDLLKNRLFTGYIAYKGEHYQGQHEPLVSAAVFEAVQDTLRRNNGRSRTISPSSPRQYLLQGMIRCAYCLMPLWAQTYNNGRRYYREHRASRTHSLCPASGGLSHVTSLTTRYQRW